MLYLKYQFPNNIKANWSKFPWDYQLHTFLFLTRTLPQERFPLAYVVSVGIFTSVESSMTPENQLYLNTDLLTGSETHVSKTFLIILQVNIHWPLTTGCLGFIWSLPMGSFTRGNYSFFFCGCSCRLSLVEWLTIAARWLYDDLMPSINTAHGFILINFLEVFFLASLVCLKNVRELGDLVIII